MKKISLIDIDPIVHIVAYTQWKGGNRDNVDRVKEHIKRFIGTIEANSKCTHSIPMYQGTDHSNFRNEFLPQYKDHRTPLEWVVHWKPAIMDIFEELEYHALRNIETDDAQSILSRHFEPKNCVIVSSDKDMAQVPGVHYNPYAKGRIDDPKRWKIISHEEAHRNLICQVLAGDATDMATEHCGIEGVGLITADKLIGSRTDYQQVLKEQYAKKYGKDAFKRADLTYKMVRLLTGTEKDSYSSFPVKTEVKLLLMLANNIAKPINNNIASLFDPPETKIRKLFNP